MSCQTKSSEYLIEFMKAACMAEGAELFELGYSEGTGRGIIYRNEQPGWTKDGWRWAKYKLQLDKACEYLYLGGPHPLCVDLRFNNILHVASMIFDCGSCGYYKHKGD